MATFKPSTIYSATFGTDYVEVTVVPISESRFYLAFEVNNECDPELAEATNKVAITRWLLKLWHNELRGATYVAQPLSGYQALIYEKLGFRFKCGDVFMDNA